MTLSILWFILIAVLWTVYLILEGFDFGVGMLLPFVAKGDRERTQTVRTIGPHWDGTRSGSSPPAARLSPLSPSGTPPCSRACTWPCFSSWSA